MRGAMPLPAMLLALACSGAGDSPESTVGADPQPPDSIAAAPDAAASPAATAATPEQRAIQRHVAAAGPEALTRWGACPFECCVYRDWVAHGPIPALGEPDAAGTVVDTIRAGTRFQADTGFVRITSPQLVAVEREVEAYRQPDDGTGAGPVRLQPGDTLLVLEYVGEGYYSVRRGGELLSVEQFWASGQGWPPTDRVRGSTLGEYAAEWWVRVTTPAGRTGWIDAYAADIGNADACGMPE